MTEIVDVLVDIMKTPHEILTDIFKPLIKFLIRSINTPTKVVDSLIDSIKPRIEVVIKGIQALIKIVYALTNIVETVTEVVYIMIGGVDISS